MPPTSFASLHPIVPPPDRPRLSVPERSQSLKRVGIITTSRADSGIYEPLVRAFDERGDVELLLLAGGTHHDAAFGDTASTLPRSPRIELRRFHHTQPGDQPLSVAATAGRATIELSALLASSNLDLVFVLGDRTEMLASALAALVHGVPIAHLHGGDVTEGAYDDSCRHAITKLAHVHFPALPGHAARIAAMGEEAWRIHTVGALALDALRRFSPSSVRAISDRIGLDFSRPTIVVAFHPETLSPVPPGDQVSALLTGVDAFDGNVLLIGPNADAGHLALREAMRQFAESRPHRVVRSSLPQADYWSALANCRTLVGNSSSGILEAASLKLPVVNVGDRQAGRLRPANVIDVPLSAQSIRTAMKRAMSDDFRAGLANLMNPYGDGRAAERILSSLTELPDKATLLRKRWPG